MKFFESAHSFPHSWEHVTTASWRKYPNPHSPHVQAVDVLDRTVDEATGRLLSERVITVEGGLPSWLCKLFNSSSVSAHVHEVSEVDPINKRMTLRTRNISWSNFITVEETCIYTQDAQDPQKTNFSQEARITAFGSLSALRSKMESAMLDRFRSTASKGKDALEHVCDNITREMQELAEVTASATAAAGVV
eukprot:Opistho-2@57421